MGACFNCGRATSRSYTLVLASGQLLQDREMCRACYTFFSESDHIRVLQGPVLTRGGEVTEE